ncbi:MAG: hypothetical protein JKX85_14585 [Phycisphaeraceae bacterium]|nr:hypothetical protein [Phycisphaeraceae bacterium]
MKLMLSIKLWLALYYPLRACGFLCMVLVLSFLGSYAQLAEPIEAIYPGMVMAFIGGALGMNAYLPEAMGSKRQRSVRYIEYLAQMPLNRKRARFLPYEIGLLSLTSIALITFVIEYSGFGAIVARWLAIELGWEVPPISNSPKSLAPPFGFFTWALYGFFQYAYIAEVFRFGSSARPKPSMPTWFVAFIIPMVLLIGIVMGVIALTDSTSSLAPLTHWFLLHLSPLCLAIPLARALYRRVVNRDTTSPACRSSS